MCGWFWELILVVRVFRMGGVWLGCVHHGHLHNGKRPLGLVHRKKTCADKAGGASRLITQQWGLLPSALSSVLLPMGGGVLQCHRESKGQCLNDKLFLLLRPLYDNEVLWSMLSFSDTSCFFQTERDR